MATLERERLSVRVPAATKRRIEQAARLSRQSLTEFVKSTLEGASERILEEHQSLTLSNEAFDEFIAALDRVEPANEAVRRAVARYRENPV